MVVPDAEPSDEALASRAALGDDQAFETLVARYQGRVWRLACRLAGETDAPDVMQDTFLKAHRSLPSFRGEARFGTWLYRIATNTGLMRRRATARRPTEPLDAFLPRFDAGGTHADTPEQLRTAGRLDELVERRILAEKARAALERLPDGYREAFVLRDLEELSTAEVAETLGLTPAAVRQRVHRARLMLRGYLNDLAGRTACAT